MGKLTLDLPIGPARLAEPVGYVSVEATTVGKALCVHRSILGRTLDSGEAVLDPHEWTVTHRPTGLGMARAPSKKAATAAARRFLSLPIAWESITRESVKSLPKEAMVAINTIRAAASVGGDC